MQRTQLRPANKVGIGGSEIAFKMAVMNEDREPTKAVTPKGICTPGDDLEPLIAVMFPDEDDRMKPVVIVALQFLFPKQNGGKGDTGEIILNNEDVPQIVGKASEAVGVKSDSGRE